MSPLKISPGGNPAFDPTSRIDWAVDDMEKAKIRDTLDKALVDRIDTVQRGSELGTEDLNTITEPGVYSQSQNAEASLALNYPVALGGRLTVGHSRGQNMVTQEYTVVSTSPAPRRFFRVRTGYYTNPTTWSPWMEYVLGTDRRLTDARTPLAHKHTVADITDLGAEFDRRLAAFTPAPDGILTAYDVAKQQGFTGTEAEWLASLRGPEGPYGGTSVTDPQVAGMVTGPGETRTALDRAYLRAPSPQAFGVVGDGVADDTAALQRWLDAPGGMHVLSGMRCRITGTLRVTRDRAHIITRGATIVAATPESTMLEITGADVTVQVALDGARTARRGIHATGDRPKITGAEVWGLRSTTDQANGIRVWTDTGCVVEHCKVWDVVSVGDDTTGNNNGASRGITVTGSAGTPTRDNIIRNNIIEDVLGEEGDAIHVAFGSGLGNAKITGNIIRNVSRRAIKVQAGNVWLQGNVYEHTGVEPSFPSALLDIQYSDDCRVLSNEIDARFFMGVQITGTQSDNVANTVVEGNRIRAGMRAAITASWCTDLSITGNRVRGGASPVSVGNCTNVNIAGNEFRDGISTPHWVVRVLDCTNWAVNNNVVFPGGNRWGLTDPAAAGGTQSNNIVMP